MGIRKSGEAKYPVTPVDPAAVWRKLSGQFQKKTWANKLSLRKKLFTMKLGDSGSMNEYVKQMTEIFNELL